MSSKIVQCEECGNTSKTLYACGCYWCDECCDACPCPSYLYHDQVGCDLSAEEVEA
jgi:hypothetical protein